MYMVDIVVNFFNAYTWVVFCYFSQLLFDVRPNSLISYYISPVFGNKYEMVVTVVYGVVGSYVVTLHVMILTCGEESIGCASIPGLTPQGFAAFAQQGE